MEALGHSGHHGTPTQFNIFFATKIMGILSKITAGESAEKKPAAMNKTTLEPFNDRPTVPCTRQHPGPTPPYGLHHWRDLYGVWHCTQCEPPASVAMIREQMLVDPNGPPEATEIDGDAHKNPIGFRIIAIKNPGGEILFLDSTQAERKEAVDNFEWFDRVDARRAAVAVN